MLSGEQIAQVLWKRRITLLIAFAVTFAAAALTTFSLPKAYTTVSYLWVNPAGKDQTDFQQTQTSQVLARTYAELLQTRPIADAVVPHLPFKLTGGELEASVHVAPVPDSQLLSIEAESSTPRRAQLIANTYATVFQDRAEELVAAHATESKLTIASPAPLPTSASRPKPKLYLLVGLFLAAFMATLITLLLDRLDRRLHVDSSTTEIEGLSVIGRVPDRPSRPLRSHPDDHDSRSIDESFRLLFANLSFVTLGERPSSIAIVSPAESEGKTMTTFNLGRAAAELGIKVLLVDADMRRARLSSQLELPLRQPGLSTALVTKKPVSEFALKIANEPMHVVSSGPFPPNASVLLNSLADFNREAVKEYDLVIYDTPPISVGADASLVAAMAEGTIMVVSARSTLRNATLQALDQLRRARANVLGIVINRLSDLSDDYYYDRERRTTINLEEHVVPAANDDGDVGARKGSRTARPAEGASRRPRSRT